MDTVLGIHACLDSGGLRDRASLEGSLARPLATGFGVDLYPTVPQKAAALLHSLARTQAFHDGNKRTAWSCCTAYLRIHDSPLTAAVTQAEVVDFVMAIAVGELSVDAVALQLIEWLE